MAQEYAAGGGVAALPAWLVVAAGGLCLAAATYLVILAVAARIARARRRRSAVTDVFADLPSWPQIAVVVPAHDEQELIGRCVASLRAQTYPAQAFTVVVVADNCSDGTARIAADSGARVLVRHDPAHRGKGRALRWAFDQLLVDSPDLDAVVVVDADSVADSGLIRGLVQRFVGGADVAQADYLALPEKASRVAELREAAFLLFHRVRFSGRAALRLPCSLVGNGMMFSRRILEDHPWTAYSSVEDLEYAIDLRLAGVPAVYAGDARVFGPVASGGQAARTQRLRWEGGRLNVVRTRLPRLLAAGLRGRWSTAEAAVDLVVPPLGVLASLSMALLILAWSLVVGGVLPGWAPIPAAGAVIGIAGFVLIGLWAAEAPGSTYRALAVAPVVVASQMSSRARLLVGLKADTWERTARNRVEPADPVPSPERTVIADVPIDAIGMDDTIARLQAGIRFRAFTQVCTVNLDFLTNARRHQDVRRVLLGSEVNLADGAPVLWLARILGRPIPARVAGSDLVPALMAVAAREGYRVFLLGGEDGVAEEAATRLVERYPGLLIAGVHEPSRAPLEAMDHDKLVRLVNDADTDILLVALGHPKQDRWIAQNRDALHASVAIGVGCVFDLIAGRRGRAPSWMGSAGLEWLYRVAHEPRRLGGRYAGDAWCLATVLLPAVLGQRLGIASARVAVPQQAVRTDADVIHLDGASSIIEEPASIVLPAPRDGERVGAFGRTIELPAPPA